MRILVVGDLHGRKPKIHFKDFDCIVQVGDVCSDKKFRPYVDLWFKLLKELEDYAPTYEELMLSEIGKRGIKKLENESLNEGRKILEYLNSFGKPVFIVPGNWDQSYGETRIKDIDKDNYSYIKSWLDRWSGKKTNPKLIQGLKNLKDCHFENHEFYKINFLGYGICNAPEEFVKKARKFKLSQKKFEIIKKSSAKLYSWITAKYKKRNKKFPTIFISHNIPYDTKLDLILKKDSPRYKTHGGSIYARNFCKKYQPLLCIGGHIHEHFGKVKIKKTTVINAGFGKDAQVLIDVDEEKGKIRKIEFYKGYKK